MAERKLESWIDAFCQYTSDKNTSEIWRRWSAISCIAAALERKVWVTGIWDTKIYPNFYTVFVGPAGLGKSSATSVIQELYDELKDHHFAPNSVSKASLMDSLFDANRSVIRPAENPPVYSFNSLYAIINELTVFIPKYDEEFMGALTDLWDNLRYVERKRASGLHIKIDRTNFNMLAGTTPSNLNSLLPEGAWERGFMSRTILVYSAETILPPLFGTSASSKADWDNLVHDLKLIGNLYGPITFASDAAATISNWYDKKGPPAPTHPKLAGYNARRTAHLIKLCAIACVDTDDFPVITLGNFQDALGDLLRAEAAIPEIFKAMNSGGQAQIMRDAWFNAYAEYQLTKQPLTQAFMHSFLAERVPAYSIDSVLKAMVSTGLMRVEIDRGKSVYMPQNRLLT